MRINAITSYNTAGLQTKRQNNVSFGLFAEGDSGEEAKRMTMAALRQRYVNVMVKRSTGENKENMIKDDFRMIEDSPCVTVDSNGDDITVKLNEPELREYLTQRNLEGTFAHYKRRFNEEDWSVKVSNVDKIGNAVTFLKSLLLGKRRNPPNF